MESLLKFLLGFNAPIPYFFVFGILLACGLGIPIPEDITLFAAGVLSYYGKANVYVMIAIGMLGVMLGDSMIFYLGSKYGVRLTENKKFHKIIPPAKFEKMSESLRVRGNRLIFFARFMPGFRAAAFFSAGTLGLPYRVFFLFDGVAALISVPSIIYSVYYFGDQVDRVIRIIQGIEHGIAGAIFLGILFFVMKWMIKKRKRQRA
ncbi:MAG: SNARE associated protein [Bdellovibrionaceae bacterium]|nr:SNARE associated protein [Pseudobdellovibrionaceae bacterium]|tara:strand:+ start:817 stop:1431 length:615 start_codon:yes stop_codon:yes gene_type:complete